jgi:putative N6-adenine-specific DNA methylase
VTSHGSRLFHTGAIEERLGSWLGGGSPDADGETQLFVVRVAHDEVTISVDSSGEPLYKRGWRQQLSRAPLRETLAAAMLLGAGWDQRSPLVDPMCGSGTIAIEAALLARGLPPGVGRSFAFATWPSFEAGTWASVAGAARASIADASSAADPPAIVGRDRDAGAIAAARANAERAGVAALVDLDVAPISALTPDPSGPGLVLVNPPYGARVTGGHDLRDLYARFGDVMRSRFAGWTVGVLAADPNTPGHMGLPLSPAWSSTNGGIEVSLLTGVVGTDRRHAARHRPAEAEWARGRDRD